MKVVILAAGSGIRMRSRTSDTPKPLLKVAGKTLIEHTIDSLPDEVDQIIVVIGYLGGQIKKFLGKNFNGRKVNYIWQIKQLGTGHALSICRDLLYDGKFLVLYSDDIHDKGDIANLIKMDLGVLVKEVDDPRSFGVVELDDKKRVISLEEKPHNPKSNIVLTGPAVLDWRIFNYDQQKIAKGREYYITDMLGDMIKECSVFAEFASSWIPIGCPDDITNAEKILGKK